MMFPFIAKYRGVWPVALICETLGVSRSGFYAWLTRPRGLRAQRHEELSDAIRRSFLDSDRTYGARRVWHDLLAAGVVCGLHAVERLMRLSALRARPRRRRLPTDTGVRPATELAANVLNRQFTAPAPNRKWVADFTYIWTAEGWLYVAVVLDLYSRRIVGWSMAAAMTAEFVTDALMMALWRRGRPKELLHHSDRGVQLGFNRSSQHHLATSFIAASNASAGVRQPKRLSRSCIERSSHCRQLFWTALAQIGALRKILT